MKVVMRVAVAAVAAVKAVMRVVNIITRRTRRIHLTKKEVTRVATNFKSQIDRFLVIKERSYYFG
jgi:hypothetical protein